MLAIPVGQLIPINLEKRYETPTPPLSTAGVIRPNYAPPYVADHEITDTPKITWLEFISSTEEIPVGEIKIAMTRFVGYIERKCNANFHNPASSRNEVTV